MKSICEKHQQAYETQDGCPYCKAQQEESNIGTWETWRAPFDWPRGRQLVGGQFVEIAPAAEDSASSFWEAWQAGLPSDRQGFSRDNPLVGRTKACDHANGFCAYVRKAE